MRNVFLVLTMLVAAHAAAAQTPGAAAPAAPAVAKATGALGATPPSATTAPSPANDNDDNDAATDDETTDGDAPNEGHAAATGSDGTDGASEGSSVDPDYWTKALPMHPKLVHFPMALCILMPLFLIAVIIGRWRNWFSPMVWLLVLFLQGATAVSAIAALRTGEDEEHSCEGYAPEEALETHEERAQQFTIVQVGTLALVVALVLLRNRARMEATLPAIALVASLGGAYAGVRVGNAGGRLVYVASGADCAK